MSVEEEIASLLDPKQEMTQWLATVIFTKGKIWATTPVKQDMVMRLTFEACKHAALEVTENTTANTKAMHQVIKSYLLFLAVSQPQAELQFGQNSEKLAEVLRAVWVPNLRANTSMDLMREIAASCYQ